MLVAFQALFLLWLKNLSLLQWFVGTNCFLCNEISTQMKTNNGPANLSITFISSSHLFNIHTSHAIAYNP